MKMNLPKLKGGIKMYQKETGPLTRFPWGVLLRWARIRNAHGEKGQRKMKIVNLTPHELNFITEAGNTTIPPSMIVARVVVERETPWTVTIDGVDVPLYRTRYGKITGLPDPQPDTLYVVSSLVAAAARDRNDLVVPDNLVRDEQGRVVGARGLAFPETRGTDSDSAPFPNYDPVRGSIPTEVVG